MPKVDARPGPRGLRGWFADRRVRTKILSVLGLTVVTAIAVGVVSLVQLASMKAGTATVAQHGTGLQHLAEAQRVATALRADLRDHILASGPKTATFSQAISADDSTLAAELAAFESSGGIDADDRALLQGFRSTFTAYQRIRDEKVLPLSAAGDKTAAYAALTGEAVPVYKTAMAQLSDLMDRQLEKSRAVQAQADRSYRDALLTIVAVLALGCLISLALAVAVTRTITTPLQRVEDVLLGLADGDLTRHADVPQRDEIGRMADAVRAAATGLRAPIGTMTSSAQTIAAAAADLAAVNAEIAAQAQRTSDRSDAMAATADQVSANVQVVAAGTEQLGASIRQIAEDTTRAARIGGQAVVRVREANTTVTDLGESSTRIGQVLGLITSIAEQTNLLALNATIEAARAGEAGKGFAVVAGEVKDLAGETARATGDIEDKVRSIQSGTAGAVEAISSVTTDMERINEYQTSIAGAVEQQSATSLEIGRSVTEAAVGSRDIADNISGIAEAARATSAGVQRNQEAADRLTALSDELREVVAHFRY